MPHITTEDRELLESVAREMTKILPVAQKNNLVPTYKAMFRCLENLDRNNRNVYRQLMAGHNETAAELIERREAVRQASAERHAEVRAKMHPAPHEVTEGVVPPSGVTAAAAKIINDGNCVGCTGEKEPLQATVAAPEPFAGLTYDEILEQSGGSSEILTAYATEYNIKFGNRKNAAPLARLIADHYAK